MIEIPLQQLRSKALIRPPGYFEDVISNGRIDSGILILADAPWTQLRAKYAPHEADFQGDWGRRLWSLLHARPSVYTPRFVPADDAEWLADLALLIPCGDCQKHWREVLLAVPLDSETPERYFAWTVGAHNAVNRLLGKGEITIAAALSIWMPAKGV